MTTTTDKLFLCKSCQIEHYQSGFDCDDMVCTVCGGYDWSPRLWNAMHVRHELPQIGVLIAGKVVKGRILGRLNAFATVQFGEHLAADWAWSSIADCLNRGVPLRA